MDLEYDLLKHSSQASRPPPTVIETLLAVAYIHVREILFGDPKTQKDGNFYFPHSFTNHNIKRIFKIL